MRTFSFLVLCLMGFFFMACDDDENRLGDWALGSAWPGEVRNQAVCFVIGDYAYVGLGIGVDGAEYNNFQKMNLRTGNWTGANITDFPGDARHAAAARVRPDVPPVGKAVLGPPADLCRPDGAAGAVCPVLPPAAVSPDLPPAPPGRSPPISTCRAHR